MTVQGELLGSKINFFQNKMGFPAGEKLINALCVGNMQVCSHLKCLNW